MLDEKPRHYDPEADQYLDQEGLAAFMVTDGPDRIKELNRNNTPVWVKRSNDQWVQAHITLVEGNGAAVVVVYTDTADNSARRRHMTSRKLLEMQDEHASLES